jgi:hypothetical protein
MRLIINYIRSCFCKHDWEMIMNTAYYSNQDAKIPLCYKKVYRCKKCGYSKRYKS